MNPRSTGTPRPDAPLPATQATAGPPRPVRARARAAGPVAALFVLLALLSGLVLAQDDAVVLEVGDTTVTKAEFDARFDVAARTAAIQQGLEPTEENLATFATHREAFLDQYATQLALLQEAEARGVAVDAAEVDATLESFRTQFEDEEAFTERLSTMGFEDVSELREDVRTSLTVRALIDALAADAAPTEEEVRAWYDANPERFATDDGAVPFEDVRADVEQLLVQQAVDAQVQEIRADAEVALFPENL